MQIAALIANIYYDPGEYSRTAEQTTGNQCRRDALTYAGSFILYEMDVAYNNFAEDIWRTNREKPGTWQVSIWVAEARSRNGWVGAGFGDGRVFVLHDRILHRTSSHGFRWPADTLCDWGRQLAFGDGLRSWDERDKRILAPIVNR